MLDASNVWFVCQQRGERRVMTKFGSIEIFLKGGKPWGFNLRGGAETGTALTVAELEVEGKAEAEGSLRVGDLVLKINGVQCHSYGEAVQLIDSAFRTLTVLVWRSGSGGSSTGQLPRDAAVLKESSNLWQKASQLRQSFRRSAAHRKADHKVQPSGQQDVKNKRSWGSQKDLRIKERCLSDYEGGVESGPENPPDPVLLPHHTPRHPRSPRKLTKDSGYETSAQGEPDYVNAEWMNEVPSRRSDSLSSLPPADPSYLRPRGLSRIRTEDNRIAISTNSFAWDYSGKLYRSQSYVHESSGGPRDIYTSNESLDSHHPLYSPVFDSSEHCRQPSSIARYSSSDSLTSWASSSLAGGGGGVTNARSTPTLPQAVESESSYPAKSTPCLDDMVTRRFKKRSVYQTLASKSGFDFAPVIQGRPYWEKTDSIDAQKFPVKRTVQQPFCEKQSPAVIQYYSAVTEEKTLKPPSFSNGLMKAEPQQERNVSPQPPPPPIRNSSMSSGGRSNKEGSGSHEKYPSWPVTSLNPPASSSQRSHSWTESTDYPKERITYSRPKKGYKISPHQLQPVLERSSEGRRNGSGSSNDSTCTLTAKDFAVELNSSIQKALDFESLYDGSSTRHYGSDREYDVPSPPERDMPRPQHGQQMNSYLNKYNDLLYTLQQQEAEWGNQPPPPPPPLPQHLDTPFMDRLRQESEPIPAWASSPPEMDTGSEAGTCVESVGSSQETLKWHGSYSDISSLSFQVSNRSSLFDSGLSTMPDSGRLSPQSSCDGLFPESSRAQVVSRQGTHKENIAHSARVQPPKRHESESVLYYDNRHHRKSRTQQQQMAAERELCREVMDTKTERTGRTESFRSASRRQSHDGHRELKAIQKQAVLSFYHHRQSSQQETSPPPPTSSPPQTPTETTSVSFRLASSHQRSEGDDVNRWEELVQNLRQQHNTETQSPGQHLPGIKNATPEGSIIISAANYFRSTKSGRKAQLKEVRLSNDSVKVVTVLEKLPATKPPQLPPKRINKPPAPPPPPNPPSRPPAPLPPPSPSPSEDDEELRKIQDRVKRSSVLLLSGSACSSPDLPLPPPPSNTETEVLPFDDPLPPPPEHLPETDASSPRPVVPQNHMVYPKNSYMSYRSERKLGRQGFDGNYRRQEATMSPASWEQAHCIHKHGPTVIFHSESMPVQSVAHLPTSRQSECPQHQPPQMSTNRPSSSCSSSSRSSSSSGESTAAAESSCSELENNPTISPSSQKVEDVVTANCCVAERVVPHLNGRLPSSTSSSGEEDVEGQEIVVVVGVNRDELVPNGDVVPRTNSATQTTDTPRLSRKEKTKEELECERLSKDFVDRWGNPLLKNLLVPDPQNKTMSDYMEGLLSTPNLAPSSNENLAKSPPKSASPPHHQRTPVSSPEANIHRGEAGLPPNSAYFTTSEPKAKLLTRYGQDMGRQEWTSEGPVDLDKKKEELIASIGRKLELLKLEQVSLREETDQNESLGREVANQVQRLAKPNEMQKYCLHVEEMEKIINLLLSLSGRLARAQNALMNLPRETCQEERRLLEAKRDKLSAQHEEARYLKESIDRRSQQVAKFLHYYLSPEEYADYEHFVKMKSKLLMDAREVDEKIKLGEEQMSTLQNGMDAHVWHRSHSRTSSTSV